MHYYLKSVPKVSIYEWHKWFAWYPVIVRKNRVICWLETIERKIIGHEDDEALYRLPE